MPLLGFMTPPGVKPVPLRRRSFCRVKPSYSFAELGKKVRHYSCSDISLPLTREWRPSFMKSYSLFENDGDDGGEGKISTKIDEDDSQAFSAVRGSVRQPVKKEWSFTRLRPTPPYQQNSHGKSNDDSSGSPKAIRRIVSTKNKMIGGKGSKEELSGETLSRKNSTPSSLMRSNSQAILEEDMMILSVIEAYCFSARQRQTTMNSPAANRTLSSTTDPTNLVDTLPKIEEADSVFLDQIDATVTPTPTVSDDVTAIDSDDELIPIRTRSFGGSPDSPFLPPDVPPHFSFKPITPPRQNQKEKQKSLKKFKKKSDTNAEMDGLKQQVQNLHKQTLYLRENLEEERKAREHFEKVFRKVMQRVTPDLDLTDDKLMSKTTPI